jgi:hypothetical protein
MHPRGIAGTKKRKYHSKMYYQMKKKWNKTRYLVHFNVFTIKLDASDSIGDICLEPHGIRLQVEDLQISVVILRSSSL